MLSAVLLALVAWALAEAAEETAAAEQNAPAVAFRDKIYDVMFIGESEAWAVGYPGLLLHSLDGGVSWQRQNGLTDQALFALDFIGDKGWVVGRGGTLLTTVDGGKTWKKQEPLCSQPLFDVDFVDENHGWAVGNFGSLAITVDGGKTWDVREFEPMVNAAINAVYFISPTEGWLAGDYPLWDAALDEEVTAETISNLFHTTDGGQTWQLVKTDVSYALYDVLFTDNQTGWIVGSKGNLLKTTDGGETWTPLASQTKSHLFSLYQAGDTMWIAGADGVLLQVKNGQVSRVKSGAFTWLSAVAFSGEQRGIVVGGRGTILSTNDAGQSWQTYPIKH